MNYLALNEIGIDTQQALSRFCNNAAMYEKYLMKLTEDETFSALQTAMQDKNYEGAFRLAHTIKGVVGNLSVNHLFRQFTELTDCLRNASDIKSAEEIFEALQRDYPLCIEKIKEAHYG